MDIKKRELMEHIPVPELAPDLIGELVVIQDFEKNTEGDQDFDKNAEGDIKLESLVKYVGRLEGYQTGRDFITIKLSGLPLIYSGRKRHHLEIFRIEPWR